MTEKEWNKILFVNGISISAKPANVEKLTEKDAQDFCDMVHKINERALKENEKKGEK